MSKAKTNALDALRALIAERQQYEQWIATLQERRPNTPEHVFERVHNDYRSRLERVVTEIKGYAEELQLSISTLSARLVEVAREEDTRREGLQEAELRAAVGEYEPSQWEQIKTDAEAALEKIAADRVSLDGQLSELRAIQKLSEMSPVIAHEEAAAVGAQSPAVPSPASQPPAPEAPASDVQVEAQKPSVEPAQRTVEQGPDRGHERPTAAATSSPAASSTPAASSDGGGSMGHRSGTAAAQRPASAEAQRAPAPETVTTAPPASAASHGDIPLESVAAAASATAAAASKPRSMKSPTGGVQAVRSRTESARPDAAKTLKCPECGTANYPTEWYCERCGGELATM